MLYDKYLFNNIHSILSANCKDSYQVSSLNQQVSLVVESASENKKVLVKNSFSCNLPSW